LIGEPKGRSYSNKLLANVLCCTGGTIDRLPISSCNSFCCISVGKPTVTVKHVGSNSITILIAPPAGADDSMGLRYVITFGKARVIGRITTNDTTVTLDNLQPHRDYQITVAVMKPISGRFGPQTDPLKVRTKTGSIIRLVVPCVVLNTPHPRLVYELFSTNKINETESVPTQTATFPEIFNGLLFRGY